MLRRVRRAASRLWASLSKPATSPQREAETSDNTVFFVNAPRTPFVLDGLSPDEVLKHPAFDDLLKVLSLYRPDLLMQLSAYVIHSGQIAAQEQAKLEKLQALVLEKASTKASAEVSIQPLPSDLFIQERLPKPSELELQRIEATKNKSRDARLYRIGLSAGLSFMLYLSFCSHAEIRIKKIRPDQVPMALILLVPAVGLTVAAKESIEGFAYRSRRNEPQRSFEDDDNHLNLVPFWRRFAAGDEALLLGVLLTVLEACFAAPGLIELLPSAVPAIVGIGGASLAATVNALLGLDSGYSKAMSESELDAFQNKCKEDKSEFQDGLDAVRQSPQEKEILTSNMDCTRQAAEAEALWSGLQKQLDVQKEIAETAHANAVHDFRGWLYSVREWVEQNPEKIAAFVQSRQPLQREHTSQNGRIENLQWPLNKLA